MHTTVRTGIASAQHGVGIAHSGAAVVATFMLGGSNVGLCDLPATHASIMSHSIINEHCIRLSYIDFLERHLRFTVRDAVKPGACQQ
jgi:hypothetical protein